MKRNRLISVVVLAAAPLVGLSIPASAQLPPGKWWKNPEVVRDLGLSKGQVDRLEEHFRLLRPKLIDLTAEVQKLEIDLEGAIERAPFDEKRVSALMDRVADARCKVMRTEMGGMVGARAILTDEQFVLLRSRMEREGEPRPPGPPGRVGRPGPGDDPRRRGADLDQPPDRPPQPPRRGPSPSEPES